MRQFGGFDGQFGGGFGGQTGAVQAGANCTNERLFNLSKTANAFSNVADVRHDSATLNGDSCALCSGEATPGAAEAQTDYLGYGIAFVLGAVVASAVFVTVGLIRKKRRNG